MMLVAAVCMHYEDLREDVARRRQRWMLGRRERQVVDCMLPGEGYTAPHIGTVIGVSAKNAGMICARLAERGLLVEMPERELGTGGRGLKRWGLS